MPPARPGASAWYSPSRRWEFLRADDPDTVAAISPRMESWHNITLNLRGESIEIDGVGFSSIGRLELLTTLQRRAMPRPAWPRCTSTP